MSEERLEKIRRRIGIETVGDWVQVTQAMINDFADATGDHQFLHVDPEAARHTQFGGTIAHGFLTLSLFPLLASTAPGALPLEGARMGVNYGANRVRFLTPVRSGARIRGRFTVRDVVEKHSECYQQRTDFVVEIEGEAKPALVAEWIVQVYF